MQMSNIDFDTLMARAATCGAKQQHIADLSEVGASKISRATKALETLDYPDLRRIERVVVALENICARSAGPLDFRELRAVRKLVDEFYTPLTVQEQGVLTSFARGTPIEEIASSCRLTVPAFLTHVAGLIDRSSRDSQTVK
jgi:hypothetical protein